jgi:hypothetical protein
MRSRKSKKGRQYNRQKEREQKKNNYPQITTQKTKDWEIWSPLKTGVELSRSEIATCLWLLLPHMSELNKFCPLKTFCHLRHDTLLCLERMRCSVVFCLGIFAPLIGAPQSTIGIVFRVNYIIFYLYFLWNESCIYIVRFYTHRILECASDDT